MLLGFTRALRAAGVPVTQDRAQGFLAAVALLGLDDQRATYLAGRATLCAGPDDLERYDQVFEAFFNARDGLPRARPAAADGAGVHRPARRRGRRRRGEPSDDEVVRAMASETEVLRHRDVASLTAAEKHRLAGMFATLRPRPPLRRTARHQRLAPRRRRRVPHPARQPAADGRARRDRLAPSRRRARAGWCCWSTCPAR